MAAARSSIITMVGFIKFMLKAIISRLAIKVTEFTELTRIEMDLLITVENIGFVTISYLAS